MVSAFKTTLTIVMFTGLVSCEIFKDPELIRTHLGFPEEFELGTKNNYSDGIETFGSGKFQLKEALVGSSTLDCKFGKKSIRIKDNGAVYMLFDVANPRQIEMAYGKYGTDPNSQIDVLASIDQGKTWLVIEKITVASDVMKTQTIHLRFPKARFGVRKSVSDGSRVNIDNFSVRVAVEQD